MEIYFTLYEIKNLSKVEEITNETNTNGQQGTKREDDNKLKETVTLHSTYPHTNFHLQ